MTKPDRPGKGDSDSEIRCDRIQFETILQSVQEKAAEALTAGDTLDVILEGENGPIIARHPTAGQVGTIIPRVYNLLGCLRQGHEYRAEVLEVSIPSIKVRIAHR